MRQRRASWAWLLYTVFIVYGGTIPFHFAADYASIAEKLHQLPLSPWISPDTGRRLSIPDFVQNILLFVPFGALGFLAGDRRGVRRVLRVTGLGASLSLIVETLQLFTIDRTTSIADVATNTAGTLAGSCLAVIGHHTSVRLAGRLRRSGHADVVELRPLAVLSAVLLVTAWQPFDFTLDVGVIVRKLRAFGADPWQFTVWRDEGLIVVVTATFAAALAAYLAAIDAVRPAGKTLLITAAIASCLGAGQLLITSRMPGLWDGCVFAAGAAAGALAWRARTRFSRPAIWDAAIIAATAIAVVLSLLSPFQISGTYQSFGWIPLYGYYARTTLQTLSHVIELLLLYFPLGFCLALRSGRNGRRWALVALVALVIAAPIEYLQGWIAGRFPDASDVAVSLAGACLGAWMASPWLVQSPDNGLTKGRNSADKT